MKLAPLIGYNQTKRLGLQLPVSDGVDIDAQLWTNMANQIDAGLGGSESGQSWEDDFMGAKHYAWTSAVTCTGTGALQSGRNGWWKMSSGATATGSSTLNWNNAVCIDPASNIVFGVGMCQDTTWGSVSSATVDIGLVDATGANAIGFNYTSGGLTAYWQGKTVVASSSYLVSTTQVASAPIGFSFGSQTPTWLRIEVNSVAGSASFYVCPVTAYNVADTEVLIGTITNIPAAGAVLQPRIKIVSATNGAQNLYVDYVYLTTDR